MSLFEEFYLHKTRLEKFLEVVLLGRDASETVEIEKMDLGLVAFVVNTRCNMNCLWCYRRDERYKKSLGREIDEERFYSLLPEIAGFSEIGFGGIGEPTLTKFLPRLIENSKKYVKRARVTTNGSTLTDSLILDLYNAGLDLIEISIDGFDSITNELYRGIDEELILATMYKLAQSTKIEIQINSVVSDHNYKALFNMVERIKDISNLVVIHTIPIFFTEYIKGKKIGHITDEEYRRLLERLSSDIKKYQLEIQLNPDSNEVGRDPLFELKRRHNICFHPFDKTYIGTRGELHPCPRLSFISMGDVFEEGIMNAKNNETFRKFRRNMLDGKNCDECKAICNLR